MKTKLIYSAIIAFYFLTHTLALAQEESKTAPIEFPEFIIEGKERIDVPSGSKQYPNKPDPLTKTELDSLNPLRKQPTDLLPQKKYPRTIYNYHKEIGYLKGEFGTFTTPSLEAAFNYDYLDYSFYASGLFESSSGDAKNSDYSKAIFDIGADYTAPEKYWVFGGSKTKAKINFDNKGYNLYGSDDPASRNKMNLGLNIHSDGYYEGYNFSTGAGFRTLQLSDKHDDYKTNAYDNTFFGYLDIKKSIGKTVWGGGADLDFGSIKGSGIMFLQAKVFASFLLGSDINIKILGGLQASESQAGITKGGLKAEGNIEYRLNHNFTLVGGLLSGLEKNSLFEYSNLNPYISTATQVEYPYNVFLIKGLLYFHPNELFSFSGGIQFGVMDDTPVFISSDSSVFNISYQSVSKIRLLFEGILEPTNIDNIVFNIIANFSNLTDNGKIQPYTPIITLSTSYKRQWFDSFGTIIGLDFIGERYADIDNNISLDSYFNLKTKFFYNINDNLQVFLNIENLLNSDIYLWNYYKERGIYLSGGLFWKF